MTDLEELYGKNEERGELLLSYSRTSDYDRNGPKALIKKSIVKNEGAKIGSLTDDLLLNKENFKKLYHIFDGEKPTATLGKLCTYIIDNFTKVPSKETVLKIIRNNKYWNKQKDETILNNFDKPEFWKYLESFIKYSNKTLVTTSDMILASTLKDTLLTHKFSKHIFNNDCETHNQFKFNIKINDLKYRGIIDILQIDHDKKTIRIIDLKTGANSLSEFLGSFLKFRYYLQEAVYMHTYDFICEKFKLKGYSLLPFQFLYISRFEKIPVVFTVKELWNKAAIKGFTTNSGYRYKGLYELIEEIKWHWDNKVFDIKKSIYLSNGNIDLNDDFITINNNSNE